MEPIAQAWYRRLVWHAALLGLVASVLVLLYTAATKGATDAIFGEAETGFWTGEWWWVVLVGAGGLLVAGLRQWFGVPDKVPGAVGLVKNAWIDPGGAPRLVAVSVVSLISGASLGPSFGLIIMGGGLGSWLVTRLGNSPEEARQEYALTGMAGSLGAAFSAPVFGAVLISELSPTRKQQYVAAFIPQLIAATLGFVVFFGITDSTLLDAYEVPSYDFEYVDLLLAVVLGAASVAVLLLFVAIDLTVAKVARLVPNNYARGLVGGGLVGLIAFAIPVTLTSGSSQLAVVVEEVATLSTWFVAAALVAKMVAVSVSLSSGFLGGNVFPLIFIGGTSGVLVHLVIPDIPLSLALAAMMAGVPGAYLKAPLSLILIAGGTVGLGADAIAPIAITVVIAHLSLSLVRFGFQRRMPSGP